MHHESVHEGCGDFTAVPIAREALLYMRAIGVLAEKESVQLHVVLFGINHKSVGLEVTLEQFGEVCTMA